MLCIFNRRYLFLLLYVTQKDTKPKSSFFRVVQIEQRPRSAEPLFCFHVGPPPTTLDQHENNSGSMSCVYWAANTFRYPNSEQAVRKQPQLQRHLIIVRELCCKIRCFLRLPCKVGGIYRKCGFVSRNDGEQIVPVFMDNCVFSPSRRCYFAYAKTNYNSMTLHLIWFVRI